MELNYRADLITTHHQAIGATKAISGSVRWAERQSNEHWTLVYLLQNRDWHGNGTVVEKRGRRDVVLIPELAYEGSIFSKQTLALDSQVRLAFQEANLPYLEAYFQEIG